MSQQWTKCQLNNALITMPRQMKLKDLKTGNFGRTKYIANHAVAFMVRGLVGKWKQPVGYSGPMSGSTMKSLLFQCIEKLTGIALTAKAVICDQGSDNQSLFESGLNVSILKPYFIALEQKVYLLYDPPHLVKNVRNNLRKHGFVVDGSEIVCM